MKKLTLALVVAMGAGTPVLASHANPWADADDTVNAQYHDENQEKSIETPGEDEQLGNMVQNVSDRAGGGLGGTEPQDGTGHKGGDETGSAGQAGGPDGVGEGSGGAAGGGAGDGAGGGAGGGNGNGNGNGGRG